MPYMYSGQQVRSIGPIRGLPRYRMVSRSLGAYGGGKFFSSPYYRNYPPIRKLPPVKKPSFFSRTVPPTYYPYGY